MYKLIVKDHLQLSPEVRASVIEALGRSRRLAGLMSVESLPETPEALVSQSPHLEKITKLSSELSQCGAKVEIIRIPDLTELPSKLDSDFERFFDRYARGLFASLVGVAREEIEHLVEALLAARDQDRQIFVIGNGGSAATASHWVNDLSKERFSDDRTRFRIMSLTDNLSWITATANDFGYEKIFENQLKNLMRNGDLLIAISSSGNSENIIRAVRYARSNGATTIGIAGFGGGKLASEAEHCILIPSKPGQYGFMEDVTSILGHIVSIHIYEQDAQRFS